MAMQYSETDMAAFRTEWPDMDDLPDEMVSKLTYFAFFMLHRRAVELGAVIFESLPKWIRTRLS